MLSTMPATPIRVLWLKDNRPGHVNKVKGFLASLAKARPLEITTWEVRWRCSLLRHLVGRLSGTRFLPPPSLVLKNFPPQGEFDLIISSGGLTQWPNTLLAKRLGVPNVYIGSPHHFSPNAFTLVPMTDPPHGNPPFLKLDLVPSEVSPDAARQSAREHLPVLEETAWTLLIGGDGEGMKWSHEDFMKLADRFLEEADKAGRKVLVATSRRTPARVENALRERFEAYGGFLSGAWFHASGGKTVPLLALFGASSRIIVTADSVSMTNEAVAAGVHAVAVYPPEGTPKPRHEGQFSILENEGKLARIRLVDHESLGAIAPACGWCLVTGDQHAALAETALRRLGLSQG
jgi:mitochondrial fission protein ELM1